MAYRFEKIKCNGKEASQFFMFSIKFLADFFYTYGQKTRNR